MSWAGVAMEQTERAKRLETENQQLRAALLAFADHFGPLEDNHMLNDDCRRCFSLAREALAVQP